MPAVNPRAMPGAFKSIESYRNKPWRNAGLGR
nr:MAG TPA: TUMOR PROTEIN 63, STERILE ALPHA MOTIF, 5-HELIX.6A [Caudoviricetes sp.]